MNRTKLTQPQIEASLDTLNATVDAPWSVVDGGLHKTFQFPDFNAAFGFMTRCALVAERMDHHPSWHNVYKTVRVDLSTHDAGGITELDFLLARRMETMAGG